MKKFIFLPLVFLVSNIFGQNKSFDYRSVPAQENKNLKPRIVVLTDIAPNDIEPDDMESMVRLLVHADLFEVEALIATTGWNNTGGKERLDLLQEALNAYEKDLPNLKKRSGQETFREDESKQEIGYWPGADYFRSRTVLGSTKMGMKFIGEGNDSEGSKRIIALADEDDERPIWITVWGGGNTFAQAIWRVQHDRSDEQLKTFLSKFRIYTITDQDRPWSRGDTIRYTSSAHQWMRKFEKDLKFLWCECAWKLHNETGVKNWNEYATNIQGHGNLGRLYPKYKWGVEGDTPSFLHVIPNGLSDPDSPTQVSWSGYFEFGLTRDSITHAYTNYTGIPYEVCAKYFNYFYPASFNDFTARMDWADSGTGNRNPVVIVNGDKGLKPLTITGKNSISIRLDASRSVDPDKNRLRYKWWIVTEAGHHAEGITISDNESAVATVRIPANHPTRQVHVICEVTDDGIPNLTSYRRIIIE